MTQKNGKKLDNTGWSRLSTLLTHSARPKPPSEGVFVNGPVTRGSTVLFPTVKDLNSNDEKRYNHELTYGAMGNDTQFSLEALIAAIEGGQHAQIVGSGLLACTFALQAFLKSGDHLLLPDSVYGPTRRFALKTLSRFGIETSFYPPLAGEEELKSFLKPNSAVIFAESPGSHTFEVQDIKMIARLAHENGAKLLLDNSWGIGAFQPFEHGVDVSIQALTKYPSGHSDVVLGAVTVADKADWKCLRDEAIYMGLCASSDDCWLTLRGLRTMALRLEKQSETAYDLAVWLKSRPEISMVRHPALPECPGHEFWKRDFHGASGVFGVELQSDVSLSAMENMLNNLHYFGIGASWGGYESLVLPTQGSITRCYKSGVPQNAAFRLQIGLESYEELRQDLERGLESLKTK
ncbi:cystathionine beta-lyase [Aristophania vespae]|uniref:cystathionine beta-lyase n=1 Tax=Aristophania vespae TaxID=2697033 RepID=UPI00235198B1|nr:cystathionine beta-lyase [Aristophania vespae]UMM64732.1 Cystathionine beta-lyase MetC [Aristophania vespae]